MPNHFIGNWAIEQYGESVTISLKLLRGSVSSPLHMTWFGYMTGFTKPFDDEPSANYAFHEVIKFIEGLSESET